MISFDGVGHSQRPLSGPAEIPSESAPEAAAAAVDLAKVQAMLDQAIEAAAHELAEQKRQAEAKRLEAMDSRRLLAEVARMREKLPSTEQLAAQDPQVQATRQRFQQVQEQQFWQTRAAKRNRS